MDHVVCLQYEKVFVQLFDCAHCGGCGYGGGAVI